MGNQKVNAAMLAAALGSILLWIAHQFCGISIPPEVASSITTLLTFLVHAAVPERDLDDAPNPQPKQEIIQ